jgi:hypothetical protein
MRKTLVAAAAFGALLSAPVVAQTENAAPLSGEEITELEGIFSGAGFTGFCEVTDTTALQMPASLQMFGVNTAEDRTLFIVALSGTPAAATGAVPACADTLIEAAVAAGDDITGAADDDVDVAADAAADADADAEATGAQGADAAGDEDTTGSGG